MMMVYLMTAVRTQSTYHVLAQYLNLIHTLYVLNKQQNLF